SAGGRRDPDLLRKLLVPKLLTAVIDIEARQAAVLDIEGLASERADRRQRVSAAERPFELVRDTVLTRLLGSRLRVLEDGGAEERPIRRAVGVVEAPTLGEARDVRARARGAVSVRGRAVGKRKHEVHALVGPHVVEDRPVSDPVAG